MARKLEIFICPNCGGENRVAWTEKQTERTLPCIACGGDEYVPQTVPDPKKPGQMKAKTILVKDSDGGDVEVADPTPAKILPKNHFKVVRGEGARTEEEQNG